MKTDHISMTRLKLCGWHSDIRKKLQNNWKENVANLKKIIKTLKILSKSGSSSAFYLRKVKKNEKNLSKSGISSAFNLRMKFKKTEKKEKMLLILENQ